MHFSPRHLHRLLSGFTVAEMFGGSRRLLLRSLVVDASKCARRSVARSTLGGCVSATLALTAPAVAYAEDSAPPAASVSTSTAPAKVEGDWMVRCVQSQASAVGQNDKPVSPPSCEAVQSVNVQQDGHTVEILKLAISPAKDKAGKSDWALIVLFPLDVLLNSDFGLSTDKEKPSLYRYRNCNHLGCFGVVPLDKAALGRLSKSKEGTVYFRLLTGKAVKVLFSLKGFGSAFDVLQSRAGAAAKDNAAASGNPK